ncbi:MAG: phage holin family protein [Deltaproteobacteria bacterium]|nr:phage holin family protein [Deltaproteobacteria bacterium]MDQ3296823.1 phage holin family protein [Myxococcota bacterium]
MGTYTGPTKTNDISNASMPELFSGLIADAKDIAVGHLGKMRGEIGDEFKGLKSFLLKVALAVGLGVLGAILLSHAFALALAALGLPLWGGYLISAVIFVSVGVFVLKRLPGDTKDIDLVPESAIAGLKRDMTEVKDDARYVRHQVRTE